AGVMETSLMLLFHPDLVDLGKTDDPLYEGLPAELPNYDVLPIVPGYTPPSGCLSSPVESSREKGAILRNVAVKHMVEAVKHEFSGEGDYHEV
ncbi:MAG: creatininase family protein, partial [Eggerthella lenta]|nr:creatininase family protein [Eggerthella lenta]